MKHLQIFASEASFQTAVEEGSLVAPYVADAGGSLKYSVQPEMIKIYIKGEGNTRPHFADLVPFEPDYSGSIRTFAIKKGSTVVELVHLMNNYEEYTADELEIQADGRVVYSRGSLLGYDCNPAPEGEGTIWFRNEEYPDGHLIYASDVLTENIILTWNAPE